MFEGFLYSEPPRPSLLATSCHLDSSSLPNCRTLSQTGVWILEDEPDIREFKPGGRLEGLARFLAEGSPPLAIGWGSMLAEGVTRQQMLQLALDTVEITGMRGVIIGGTAQLEELVRRMPKGAKHPAVSKCFFISEVPHQWLFKKCLCAIHHGGAGTTHAVLLAGIPQVVTPVYMDQFELAQSVNDLAIGFGFDKGLASISAQELADGVSEARTFADTVATIQTTVAAEANMAVPRAAEILTRFMNDMVLTGNWKKQWATSRQSLRKPTKEAA